MTPESVEKNVRSIVRRSLCLTFINLLVWILISLGYTWATTK